MGDISSIKCGYAKFDIHIVAKINGKLIIFYYFWDNQGDFLLVGCLIFCVIRMVDIMASQFSSCFLLLKFSLFFFLNCTVITGLDIHRSFPGKG